MQKFENVRAKEENGIYPHIYKVGYQDCGKFVSVFEMRVSFSKSMSTAYEVCWYQVLGSSDPYQRDANAFGHEPLATIVQHSIRSIPIIDEYFELMGRERGPIESPDTNLELVRQFYSEQFNRQMCVVEAYL